MRTLIYITAILTLSGCSSRWHLKRALKKGGQTVRIDTLQETVTLRDTVYLPGTDTFVTLPPNMPDSFIQVLRDEFATIYARTVDGKTQVRYERKDTTIFIEKPVLVRIPYEKVVYEQKKRSPFWNGFLFSLFVLVVLGIVFRKYIR